MWQFVRFVTKLSGQSGTQGTPASPRPVLKLFPKGKPKDREIPYKDREIPYTEVVSIAFTGEDTASGKSWEAWVAKKESDRCAEAKKVAEAASARGHL